MAIITGGNQIHGHITPGVKQWITWCLGVPTDAKVGGTAGPGGTTRTPANGEKAGDVTNGDLYERQTGVWVKINTISTPD